MTRAVNVTKTFACFEYAYLRYVCQAACVGRSVGVVLGSAVAVMAQIATVTFVRFGRMSMFTCEHMVVNVFCAPYPSTTSWSEVMALPVAKPATETTCVRA